MLVTLPESPAVAFGTPSRKLPKKQIALLLKAAASDPDVAEAHLISFRELHLMKSSKPTLALIARTGSVAHEVAQRVHAALAELAPNLERVVVIGVPAEHRLVHPIRCVHGQILFDYGRN
jgi:hypothetical protein